MRRSTVALISIAAVIVLLAIVLKSTDTGASADTTTSAPDSTVAASSTAAATSTTTSTTLPPGVAVCDLYQSIATTGHVTTSDLVEASGLAVSRTTADVLWSHNDSRGSATLFALSTDGQDLGEFPVPGAFALDWEDISSGPGPSGEGAYLYVGDIGDNFGIRGGLVTVYRVGDIAPSDLGEAFPESTALTYRYPAGENHNAEALFIDPSDPALYLMTKAKDATFVFRGSLEPSSGPIDLELVATLFLGAEATAADMSSDGSMLAVRGYDTVWMWHRGAEESIHDLLTGEPCEAPSPEERQGEAITLDAELSYWTVSEGSNSAIQMIRRER
jgi:hypothetical protein